MGDVCRIEYPLNINIVSTSAEWKVLSELSSLESIPKFWQQKIKKKSNMRLFK